MSSRFSSPLIAMALAFASPAMAQDPDVSGQIEAASSTTPKEKVDFANGALSEMSAAEKSVRKMLDQAQKEGEDANAKVQCLSNKLASIRALEEVSSGANVSMQEALAGNQTELAEFHFRKIAVAISKVRQFLAEAEACMGQSGTTGGTESVDVTGDLVSENIDDYFDNTLDTIPPPPITPFD